MNDPLELVGRVAARARLDAPPEGHVARRVLARLSETRRASVADALGVFTACVAGLTALVVIAVAATSTLPTTSDPLGTFFETASLSQL